MKSFVQFLLFVLAITLALAGLYAWKSGHFERGAGGPQAPGTPLPAVSRAVNAASVPGLAALDEEFGRVAEAVIPAVVSITAPRGAAVDPREELMRQFFGLGRPPQPQGGTASQGSGVVVSADGHIVTNLHVIDGSAGVSVSLSDGRRFPAVLLGADELLDIAVLKIDAEHLRPLSFADSEKVKVGQLVFAVGNPFGLQETITQGIISARERLFSSESLKEFFQTDAPINPGNSGGPLVNIFGEIVGINNFIFSQSGGSQGIGFATPSNTVRRVLEQILQHGRVLRPYFGVVLQQLDANLAAQLGLPDTRGALVEAVLPGSPAAEAGVRRGDVIRKFDGRDIRDFNDLRKRVAEAKIDSEVKVEIVRDGRPMELTAVVVEQQRPGLAALASPPSGGLVPQAPVPPPAAATVGAPLAGISVQEITPDLVQRHRLPANIEGVLVEAIAPGTPAAGILRPGDAIEMVNDTPVSSPAEFARAADGVHPGERAILLIARGRVRSFEVVGP